MPGAGFGVGCYPEGGGVWLAALPSLSLHTAGVSCAYPITTSEEEHAMPNQAHDLPDDDLTSAPDADVRAELHAFVDALTPTAAMALLRVVHAWAEPQPWGWQWWD